MGIDEQIKTAFQDLIAPELHAIRGDIRVLDQKIESLDQKMTGLRTETVPLKGELLAEIRRLDARIDGVDRELRTAIDIRERLAALEARRSP
jgi:cell division septum initiation protein DivIVA